MKRQQKACTPNPAQEHPITWHTEGHRGPDCEVIRWLQEEQWLRRLLLKWGLERTMGPMELTGSWGGDQSWGHRFILPASGPLITIVITIISICIQGSVWECSMQPGPARVGKVLMASILG